MYNEINQLLIYRDILEDPVIEQFCKFLTAKENYHKTEHLFTLQYSILDYKFTKINSWKELILALVLYTENIFTLQCEKKISVDEELLSLVTFDIATLRKLYNYPWDRVLEEIGI